MGAGLSDLPGKMAQGFGAVLNSGERAQKGQRNPDFGSPECYSFKNLDPHILKRKMRKKQHCLLGGLFFFLNPHRRICMLIDLREKGWKEEREREIHRWEREALISCLLYTPQPRSVPRTQACALTRNRTGNLLVYRDNAPNN